MNVQTMVSIYKRRVSETGGSPPLSNAEYTQDLTNAQNVLVRLVPKKFLKTLYTQALIIKANEADWSTLNNYFDVNNLRSDVDMDGSRILDRVQSGDYTRELIDIVYVVSNILSNQRKYWAVVEPQELSAMSGTIFEGDSDRGLVSLYWGTSGFGLHFSPNPQSGDDVYVCYLGAPRDMEYDNTFASVTAVPGERGQYLIVATDALATRLPGYYNGMYMWCYDTKMKYKIIDSYYSATGYVLKISTRGDFDDVYEPDADDVFTIDSEFPEWMHDMIIDYTVMKRFQELGEQNKATQIWDELKTQLSQMGVSDFEHDSK